MKKFLKVVAEFVMYTIATVLGILAANGFMYLTHYSLSGWLNWLVGCGVTGMVILIVKYIYEGVIRLIKSGKYLKIEIKLVERT